MDVSDIEGAKPRTLYQLKARRKTDQSYSPTKVSEALQHSEENTPVQTNDVRGKKGITQGRKNQQSEAEETPVISKNKPPSPNPITDLQFEYRFGRKVGIEPKYVEHPSTGGRKKVEIPPKSPDKPRGKLHLTVPDHTEDPEVALNKSFGRHKRVARVESPIKTMDELSFSKQKQAKLYLASFNYRKTIPSKMAEQQLKKEAKESIKQLEMNRMLKEERIEQVAEVQALDKWEQDHQHQLPEKREPPPDVVSSEKANSRRGKRLTKEPSKSAVPAVVKETSGKKTKETKPSSAQKTAK